MRTDRIHWAVSGTPGTGKTTLAKRLAAALKVNYISLTDVIKREKLAQRYDRRDKTYDVSIPRLERYLTTHLDPTQSYVLDSHLSHLLSPALVDVVITCSCDLQTLNKRFTARRYSAKKRRDNLDAEIFDTCFTESIEKGHPTLKVDCTKKISEKELQKIIARLRRSLQRPRP